MRQRGETPARVLPMPPMTELPSCLLSVPRFPIPSGREVWAQRSLSVSHRSSESRTDFSEMLRDGVKRDHY